MKEGRSLQELAAEIVRQAEAKKDYLADTRSLSVAVEEQSREDQVDDIMKSVVFQIPEVSNLPLPINQTAHNQICDRLKIPKKYYDLMLSQAPELLVTNVNHWFQERPERRMLRTLDGRLRAFLSNKYRPLDNYELAEAVLPILGEQELDVRSCELTESRLYIKAVTPRLEGEIEKGDPVQAGICISNSEIGHSSLKIEPLIFRLVCLNGMISADASMKKYHTGSRLNGGSDETGSWEYLRDETRQQADKALWMSVQDLTRAALDDVLFDKQIQDLRKAKGEKIESPVKAIEVCQNKFDLSDGEKDGILMHLAGGGDMSKYGVLNAVTRYSQDVEDYDRATDLERLGGKILTLPQRDWNDIAQAN